MASREQALGSTGGVPADLSLREGAPAVGADSEAAPAMGDDRMDQTTDLAVCCMRRSVTMRPSVA